MISIFSRAAVAKMHDPEIPVVYKEIMLPGDYNSEIGVEVEINEVSRVSMIYPIGIMLTQDREIVTVMQWKAIGNKVIMKFGKVKSDSSTGKVTVEELEDGSDDLRGVILSVIAVGDMTDMVVPSQPIFTGPSEGGNEDGTPTVKPAE